MLPPTPCTATALKGNNALTDLILSGCGIDGRMMSYLYEVIATIPTLRVLNLTDNKLGTEEARHLGKGRLRTIKPVYVVSTVE